MDNITETYKVYVQFDFKGNITAVNSSAFLSDSTGWMQIDEGTGDRYHHAQGNYFEGGLYTLDGIPLYRLDDGKVIKKTPEEIESDRLAIPPTPVTPTNNELMDAILELAELIIGGTV